MLRGIVPLGLQSHQTIRDLKQDVIHKVTSDDLAHLQTPLHFCRFMQYVSQG